MASMSLVNFEVIKGTLQMIRVVIITKTIDNLKSVAVTTKNNLKPP